MGPIHFRATLPDDTERLKDMLVEFRTAFYREENRADSVRVETARRCAEICREHADRAPGGIIPVGAAAKACDQIRREFGIQGGSNAE
jgi:hypothetical protein